MTEPKDSTHPVEEIVLACFDAGDVDAALDAACVEHPEYAATIRRVAARFRSLEAENEPHAGDLRRLGPFEIVERLGEGGMGVVYRAWQDPPGREVALKIVRPELLHFEGSRERFRREVEASVKLSHPGIVPVYEVGTSDGVPWFSMVFVRGKSVATVLDELRERDPTTLSGKDLRQILLSTGDGPDGESSSADTFQGGWPECVVRLVHGVAAALAHAHARGVLHRDVKPSNIMLTADGRAMLLDFGLAVTEDSQQLTRTNAVLGSLPYSPPEQVRGDGSRADVRLDVYSLGVTLYELLTLRNPFVGATSEHTTRNVLDARAESPRRRNPKVPRDLETVCATAMAEVPQRRYATMADFVGDLDKLRAGLAISASPDSMIDRAVRFVRRNRVLVTATVAIMGSLVVGTAMSVAMFFESERQRGIAELRRSEADEMAYVANVAGAEEALRRHRPASAIEALQRTTPTLRGWEFRHLLSRLDSSRSTELRRDAPLTALATGAGCLAVATADSVVVLDGSTGAFIREVPAPSVRDLVFAGRHLVWADGIRLHSLDVETGAVAAFGEGRWTAVAAHPEGDRVAAAGARGRIAIWRVRDGKRLHRMRVRDSLRALSFAPDGRRLACGGLAMVVHVFDVETEQRLHQLPGHRGAIEDVAFGPGGRRLASASRDRTARLWSAADGGRIGFPLLHEAPVTALTFRAGGLELVTAAGAALTRWSVRQGLRSGAMHGHLARVRDVSTSPDGGILSVADDGTLRRFDASAAGVPRILAHPGAVRDVAISPNGALVASVAGTGVLRVWSLASREIVYDGATHPIPGARVTCFDAKSESVACVGRSGFLVLSVGDWSVRCQCESTGALLAATFSPDGCLLATSGEAGTPLTLWNAATGEVVRRFAPSSGRCESIAFTPDGSRLLVAGSGGVGLRVLDVGNGASVAVLSTIDWRVVTVAADGVRVAAAGSMGAQVWRLDTTGPESTLAVGRVADLLFEPRGDRLITGGVDGVLRVWAGDAEVARLRSVGAAFLALSFDAGGAKLVTSDDLGEVRVWSAVSAARVEPILARLRGEIESLSQPRGASSPVPVVATRFEAESLVVRSCTGGTASIQPGSETVWSGGGQVWWRGASVGDTVVLEVPVAGSGRCALVVRLTRSFDYGAVAFAWNGVPLGGVIDGQNAGVQTFEQPLGDVDVRSGVNTLSIRFAEVRKPLRPTTSPNGFGIDQVHLSPR